MYIYIYCKYKFCINYTWCAVYRYINIKDIGMTERQIMFPLVSLDKKNCTLYVKKLSFKSYPGFQ